MVGYRGLVMAIFAAGLAACGGADPEEAADMAAQNVPRTPYPFEGLWANSFTDCSLEPGVSEQAPILIVQGRFVGLENECTLTEVTVLDEASGRYGVTRQCMAEGERYEDSVVLRVLGDTLMMQSDDISVTWTRCPAGAEGE
ncbi:MAG: hypothetical protein AAGA69_12480 [Pseudomonadota bacterium]